MGKDVAGVGSLNLDTFYRLENLSLLQQAGWPVVPHGEVFLPDDQMDELESFLRRHGRFLGAGGGGSAANAVYALTRMGFATGFIGVVGSDPTGAYLKQAMAPVDTSTIVTVGGRSGVCLIILDEQGERTIVAFPQANARLAEARLNFAPALTARYVHLSSLVGRQAIEVQFNLVASLPDAVRVSFDPGEIYARLGLAGIEAILRRSYVVFVTASELSLLTGDPDPARAAGKILSLGPSIVVCKQGERGSLIFTREENITVPAEKVSAVDTTGAGDVYVAGFLAGLLSGLPLPACGGLATAAAARSITGRGRDNYPGAGLLQEWLAGAGATGN